MFSKENLTSKKAHFIYKVIVFAVIALQFIYLAHLITHYQENEEGTVYRWFAVFSAIDIIIIGAIKILNDILLGEGIFIVNFFSSRLKYREQICDIGIAKLKQRYTGTAMGWAWAVLRPSLTIFVFWFAIALGLRSGGNVGEYPYFLWLIAGFMPWFYMSDMVSHGAGCIRNNAYLMKVAKFPVITIPMITSVSFLPVHIILLIATAVIFLVSGFALPIHMIQLPVYMLMMVLFFDFWGVFAGVLSTISRDFQNLVNSFLTALFWLSGIVYNVSNLSNPWLRMLLNLNPITIIVTGYRHCFIDRIWFYEAPRELINYGIILGIMGISATWAYKKFGKILPDML